MKILHGILLLVSASLWLTPFPAQGEEGLRKATLTFFEAHCYRCHGEEKQKGRFRLDTLTTDVENPLVAEKWAEVRFRINAGEMPPEDEAQPTAEEIGGVVDELTQKIQDGAAARMAKRGLVNHYRLSRQEYAHTRNLTGSRATSAEFIDVAHPSHDVGQKGRWASTQGCGGGGCGFHSTCRLSISRGNCR